MKGDVWQTSLLPSAAPVLCCAAAAPSSDARRDVRPPAPFRGAPVGLLGGLMKGRAPPPAAPAVCLAAVLKWFVPPAKEAARMAQRGDPDALPGRSGGTLAEDPAPLPDGNMRLKASICLLWDAQRLCTVAEPAAACAAGALILQDNLWRYRYTCKSVTAAFYHTCECGCRPAHVQARRWSCGRKGRAPELLLGQQERRADLVGRLVHEDQAVGDQRLSAPGQVCALRSQRRGPLALQRRALALRLLQRLVVQRHERAGQ